MANALRLRRALFLSSTLLSRSTAACSTPLLRLSSSSPPPAASNSFPQFGSRSVHSSIPTSYPPPRSNYQADDHIDENTILFEGCDYKHWLITMDFPKDPRPSPEEMVETYVQTLAKVVGSVEEAKRRMYACSTTTYNGFQAEIDEETANKFEGMPGVVFVLPDSYIDPVNKEYGGDKYINGTIIPRPPPVQYGRQRRQRPPQENSGYNRQGPPQEGSGYPRDGQNFAQQPNFPQQNHGPRQNYPSQQNYGPSQSYPPRGNQGPTQNYPPQQSYAPQQNSAPTQNYPPQQSYAPPAHNPDRFQGERTGFQGERTGPLPPRQVNYNHGSDYPPRDQRDGNFAPPSPSSGVSYPPRNQRDANFAPPPPSSGVPYGQGGPGSYGHNPRGHFEDRTGGSYGQGANPSFGQGYGGRGENQPFGQQPQGEQYGNGQREQRSYAPPTGPPGTDQRRY